MLAAETLFWASSLLLTYTYVGYPALIWAWARLRRHPVAGHPAFVPPVSLIVVAHDEAALIEGRVENLLRLDYPRDRLEIVVASDGSTDGTPERARAGGADGVRVVHFDERRGKPAVLNDLVPRARGEIVVLGDARQRFEAGALRALVAPFADPEVGAASGELVLTADGEPTAVEEGVGAYWRYEKLIRRCEGEVDSTVGATGAVYAIRRELFEPVPEDTILDDVLIPLQISRRGYRVVFEPAARAYDRAAALAADEFRRKVRTLAGNFQLFARNPWVLDPRRNRLWVQALSHKALRLLTPLLMASALAASVLLSEAPLYAAALAAQAAFYSAAFVGRGARDAPTSPPPLVALPYVVCLLSWATVVAFLRFATGRQRVTWERA